METNKKYKFVRVKYNRGEDSCVSDWMFEPRTKQDIYDFFNCITIVKSRDEFRGMMESVRKYHKLYEGYDPKNTKVLFNASHPESVWQICLERYITMPNSMETPLSGTLNMSLASFKTKMNVFEKGQKAFYPSDGLRCCCILDTDEIVDECFTDVLEFPKIERPTIDDVRFIQWPGGTHWYAKLNDVDIVYRGEQKWNTRAEAERAAKMHIIYNYRFNGFDDGEM